ncbi:MAG TPA: OmpA family protein [Flavobacterium sp.]|nr:OmpA family protein [Flavobacterium sp.]
MKVVLNLVFFLFAVTVFGQKASLKKANQLFEAKAYVEAAQMYVQLKPNQEMLQNLGDCYYYNSQMHDAVKIYAQLQGIHKAAIDKEVVFRYAHALKAIHNYDKADQVFKAYYGYEVNTQKFIENLKEHSFYQYELKNINKEGQSGDFGLSLYGDKVVFASTRNQANPVYNWNSKPYLDLYVATISNEGFIENPMPFSKEINTNTHESSAVFTKDGKTMYFNRTNDKRVEVKGEEYASVKLFRAEFIDDKWTNVTELPFSSDSYSVQNPALNAEETKLYFASDMPGTFGSLDIFYVDILDNGDYGLPINLGENVNTAHREQFPFLSSENNLYFASNGHEGFGGLDLFVSEQDTDQNFALPINLGETINSGYDDFCYIVDEENDTGYFSSNRKGQDNIYAFKRSYVSKKFTIEGIVKDLHTKKLLPGTTVTLYNDTQRLVAQVVVDANAKYTFATQPNTKYRLEAVKDLYIPFEEEVTTDEEGRIFRDIELLLESYEDAEDIINKKEDGLTYIQLENIYFEFNKWEILPEAKEVLDVLVNMMKKYPRAEVELQAHTDSRASERYNLDLSNKRAQAAAAYVVSKGVNSNRLKWKGYGKTKQLVRCGDNCSEQEHAINRRCEFVVLK